MTGNYYHLSQSDFAVALRQLVRYCAQNGIVVGYSENMDPFFKGDMDGRTIWLSNHLDNEELVFSLLHMIGHTIQWNLSESLRALGSVLHENPNDKLLDTLIAYEKEANSYAKGVLHLKNLEGLYGWYDDKCMYDMYHLTEFYRTSTKVKQEVPQEFKDAYEPAHVVLPPVFTPKASEGTRNGLVIDF